MARRNRRHSACLRRKSFGCRHPAGTGGGVHEAVEQITASAAFRPVAPLFGGLFTRGNRRHHNRSTRHSEITHSLRKKSATQTPGRKRMKTPSEILFERHASAQSKLNGIRHSVVGQVAGTRQSWRERVIPLRWHLAGMAAVWALVALLHFERPSAPSTLVAENNGSTPRDFLVALLENRRQLGEMIDSAVSEVPPPAHPFVPRRRGEFQTASAVV